MEAIFDITPDEVPVFLAEAEEQLQVLDEGLVQLERGGQEPGLMQGLFRAAHTLKGSAGMIGHRRMVELTHALETVFDRLRKGQCEIGEELVDACLEAVDALRALCDEVPQGSLSQVDIQPLVERLSSCTPLAIPPPGGDRGLLTQGEPGLSSQAAPAQATSTLPEGTASPLTIQATISPDSVASAARAFQIMLALQEMGHILSMQPDQATIETAAPVHHFWAQFVPARPMDEVRAALAAISEIESLSIEGEEVILPTPVTSLASRVRKQTESPAAVVKSQGR